MAQYLELITPITSTTTMVVFSIFEVEFYVKDNNMFGANLIGVATVSACRILSDETISEWLPITQLTWQAFETGRIALLEMRFMKCEDNPIYQCGIMTNPDHFGVRNSYFLVRKGGSVTLYQDTHVPKSMLPESLVVSF